MPPCRITLAVVLYLALDLATPMVPGIVPLVGVPLDPVEACRTRNDKASSPTAAQRHLSLVVPQRERVSRATRWIAPASAPKVVLFRSPFEPSRSGAPSSADDD